MTVVAQALAAMAEAKTEIERLRAINAELLAALEYIIAFADEKMRLGAISEGTCERIVVVAHAAIAKTKGETP